MSSTSGRRCSRRAVVGALVLLLAATATAAAGVGELVYPPERFAGEPEAVTSTPLNFELHGTLRGVPVALTADYRSVAAGLSLAGPHRADSPLAGCTPAPGEGSPPPPPGAKRVECALRVLRLAQYGSLAEPALDWVVELAAGQGEPLGTITTTLAADGFLDYPAALRLPVELVVTLAEGTAPPVTLRSRGPAVLTGTLEDWPPFSREWPPISLVLVAADGPLAFYEESRLAEDAAAPVLVVERLLAVLGTQPTSFFGEPPRIVSTRPLAAGDGLELSWSDSAAAVHDTPVSHYHLYRNPTPGRPEGWELAARVPAAETGTVDRSWDGSEPVEYLVVHAAELPFDRYYEGLYGPVEVVAATAGGWSLLDDADCACEAPPPDDPPDG